jgi:peptidylprolyl isomerase
LSSRLLEVKPVRRRLVALTVVPLLLLATAACGESDDGTGAGASGGEAIEGVEVSGEFGSAPEVAVQEPLEVDSTQKQVVIEGDGEVVEEGGIASIHLQVISGKTGEKTVGTYEQGTPLTGTMANGEIFPAVVDGVVGEPVGSRVAVAATPEDAFGEQGAQQYGITPEETVVFVIDVVAVPLEGPQGDEAEVPESAPDVVEDDEGNVTELSFEDAPKKPADELQVIPMIEGEGEAVEKGDSVTFDYLGQVYGTDNVFDQSYTTAPRTFSVGTGNLIKAWDEGLIGVKTGSRVMIIAPPGEGYGPNGNPQAGIKGTDTLVFVIDVLGVS